MKERGISERREAVCQSEYTQHCHFTFANLHRAVRLQVSALTIEDNLVWEVMEPLCFFTDPLITVFRQNVFDFFHSFFPLRVIKTYLAQLRRSLRRTSSLAY